ncbi:MULTISPECIES: thiazole biosynthesis adenylyltransferase ThiF [Bacillaceae]|uniref:thiazole biosynthesis adenylyltransferase ThiF n=1 Tax=Bacillaceae TaxID=186817 RepID=UPI000C778589|nr:MULTISPECIES: thiazole biosynthesis adenylyltransferase ThiF [Bacillaceae]PLR68987.1 thiamine biosynthesis protein MoeB [Bacillus sp. UMB0893]
MERYSRQILFSPIGEAGQKKIRNGHVLIIGAGALGTANAEMLVRAGVGTLTIVDRDYVEWSNLQRQQLYTEEDAKQRLPKAVASKQRLGEINHEVKVNAMIEDVTAENICDFSKLADVIVDATDNFETRLVINDAALKQKIPWIYGACVGSYGLTYTVIPGLTPCLNCLLKQIPMEGQTCDTVGIISPAVQMVASYQTGEVLKLLTGAEDQVRKELLSFDIWRNQFSQIKVNALKNTGCPSCGDHPIYPFLSQDNSVKTSVLCGRDTVQIRPAVSKEMNFKELAKTLGRAVDEITANPYLLSFQTGHHRIVVFRDGRALIHGTKDMAEAKGIYQRYLG